MSSPLANGNGSSAAPQPPAPSARARLEALLDEAHAGLPSDQLAALLFAVGRMTDSPDRLLAAAAAGPAPVLGSEARSYLGPITHALTALGGGADDREPWIEGYLDELAARPRGSALAPAA
jgi:hypothetical protein